MSFRTQYTSTTFRRSQDQNVILGPHHVGARNSAPIICNCVGLCVPASIQFCKLNEALLTGKIFYKHSHHFLQNCVPHYKHRQGI